MNSITTGGYTLVEMIAVITILSFVGMASSFTVVESMRIYGRTAPLLDASYQSGLAMNRMIREIRDLKGTDSVSVMTSTGLTFLDSGDNSIAYSHSGGNLTRNGDLLAQGVTGFTLQYWQSDGTAASLAEDLHLVDIDLTVQTADQPFRLRGYAFPRVLSPASASGGPLSGSPIAHWKLDETTGTTATESIASVDGTYQNGVTLGQAGTPAGATSVRFDGSNDHVEIPHSDDYLLDNGTVQLWFNADNTSGTQCMISKDSSGYDTGGHMKIYLSGDDVGVRFQSATTTYYLSAPNLVTAGVWYHAAFTFGSDGLRLYVDGVLRDTDTYSGGMGTTSGGIGNYEPMILGGDTETSGNGVVTPITNYYDGRLDAVALFASALPAADILALHAAGGAID